MVEGKGIVSYFHGDFQTGVLRIPGEVVLAGSVDTTCLVVPVGGGGLAKAAGMLGLDDLEIAVDLAVEARMTAGMAVGVLGGAAVGRADEIGMSTGLGRSGDLTGPPSRGISNVKSDCLG